MDADTAALLEVTRRQTRALAGHLRTVARLHAQLADHLDEVVATDAKPKEAQRDDEQDSST